MIDITVIFAENFFSSLLVGYYKFSTIDGAMRVVCTERNGHGLMLFHSVGSFEECKIQTNPTTITNTDCSR